MSRPDEDAGRATEERRPALAVILVNYESWPEVEALVAALRAEPEFAAGRLRIVVVDNASRCPVPEHLSRIPPPGFELLLREENGGFAVGVNAGWRLARSPWLLVLNPDVEIERGVIGQVVERIEALSERPGAPPGVVGFALRNADGSVQGSVGVFPSLSRTIREQFIPRRRRKYQAGWRIRRGPVDWVTGACMLLNSRMMDEVGGMDEDFFLYHEEVALCRSARERGWTVEFDPSIQVTHRHPLQDRTISPKMRVIIRHSKLLYFRKHLPRWQFHGLNRLVRLEAAARGFAARIRGDRPEIRAWRVIGDLARSLGAGREVKGRDVLRLAEAVQDESGDGSGRRRGADRGHHLSKRPGAGGTTGAVSHGPAGERRD